MEAGTITKLFNVPRNSWIKFEDELLLFRHIDGAYSSCFHKGNPVHLAAWSEVEYVGEHEGFEHIEGKEFK